MVVPQILMGAYAGAKLYTSYRYWSDYSKNTRMHMKYPIRTLSRDIAPVFMVGKSFKRSARSRRYYR